MNNIKKISKSFLSKIVAVAGFYLCDIILARGLSIDDYAEWSYFFSIAHIVLWVSNFGVSLTIRTLVAKQTSPERRRYYICCGIILRFIISFIFAVAFVAFSRIIAEISGWPAQYPDLVFLIRFGCLLPFLMAFTELWKDIFIGSSDLNSLVAMALFEHVGYAAGCLIGVLIFRNIIGALAGYYFGYVLSSIMGVILTKTSFSGFNLSGETKSDLFNIFKSALPFVVTSVIAFVILEMDTVMIGMFHVGNEDLANYSVAKKLIQKAIHVNEAFLHAMLPQFAIINENNYSELQSRFRKIRNTNFLITLSLGLGMAIILTVIVPIIYGDGYENTRIYILALIPSYLLSGISQCYMQFLYFRSKAKNVSICYTLSFVINLIMNWLLIPRIGAIGAAIGTVISLSPFPVLLAIQSKREWVKHE